MKIINILGINISVLKKEELMSRIGEFFKDNKQHYLTTPNPEMILAATDYDEELFYILNKADLSLPDGVGLKFAAWMMGKNIFRITGADLVKELLFLAEKEKRKVAVLNWDNGLSKKEDIEKALKRKYPRLSFRVEDISRRKNFDAKEARSQAPEILFTTMGVPWQEKFIYHNLAKLPSVKLAIGVGGSFDFLTKKIRRAPKLMTLLGLEWLWRLIQQPRRWRRIVNAVFVFPYKFFKWRFIYPFLYRKNVVCLLYKKENGSYKILVVERADDLGHWQLPQGGTDGEDLKKAGIRELGEEINTKKFKPVSAHKGLNSYKFDERTSKFGVKAPLSFGYKGQKQNLFIAEFLGQDSDIEINFWDHSGWKWIEAENLPEEVHPCRREACVKFLRKFREEVMHNNT